MNPEGTGATRQEHGSEELFLLRLRYKEGPLQEAGANRPFLLNDPETVWVVYTGRVDVFAVDQEEGQPTGSRLHLMRLEAGEALFGLPSGEGSGSAPDFAAADFGGEPVRSTLLAVGTAGTQVLCLRRSRLTALAATPAGMAGVVRLVESWVTRLSQALGQVLPPKDCVNLEAGGVHNLPARAAFRALRGVLWVRHATGRSHLLGAETGILVGGQNYFPLTRHTWLQGDGQQELQLQCVDTAGLLREDNPWNHLDCFHQAALRRVAAQRERARVEEEARLLQRADADKGRLRLSMRQLTGVMETGDDRLGVAGDESDPWWEACGLIAGALGIPIRSPGRVERGRTRPLSAIARASGFRTREVRLTGDWWRRDAGPLLAQRKSDGQPMALLPAAPGRYILHDPVTGSRTPVDQEVAAALAPTAYMFYRTFPARPLTFRDLWRFGLQGYWKDLVSVIVLGLGAGLLGLLVPLATGILFEAVVPAADRTLLLQIALGLGASAFSIAAFQFAAGIAALRAEGHIGAPLQAAVWDRLIALPAGFFRRYTAGDLAARALSLDYARRLLAQVGVTSVLSAVFSFLGFAVLFYYDPFLAAVAAVLILLVLGLLVSGSLRQLRLQREVTHRQGKISGLLFQLLTGVAKLRGAGAESRAFGLWAREFAAQRRLTFQARNIQNQLMVLTSVTPVAGTLALFAAAAFRNVEALPAPRFVAFYAAFTQILTGLYGLNLAASSLLPLVPLLERLQPILQASPEVTTDRKDPGELTGDIEVSQVSFRYHPDGPMVLDNVSLRARPGEFVAIVGPSGSGKSTLFRLLLGFETPESGAIYYDGQDLAGLDVQAVRRQVGVVLQQARLMPGDFYSNIVGSRPLTLDDAWEAARMAGLDEDIRQMPMGMHTVVSEGGSTFSGGQRQRLLIARALAAKPRIVFFDEATSALDNQAQEHVMRSLERLQATRIVIAHRLSTIINADRIYVLHKGRVVESGTYGELMKQKGLFAQLARRQLA